jgi:hypothetical protein
MKASSVVIDKCSTTGLKLPVWRSRRGRGPMLRDDSRVKPSARSLTSGSGNASTATAASSGVRAVSRTITPSAGSSVHRNEGRRRDRHDRLTSPAPGATGTRRRYSPLLAAIGLEILSHTPGYTAQRGGCRARRNARLAARGRAPRRCSRCLVRSRGITGRTPVIVRSPHHLVAVGKCDGGRRRRQRSLPRESPGAARRPDGRDQGGRRPAAGRAFG